MAVVDQNERQRVSSQQNTDYPLFPPPFFSHPRFPTLPPLAQAITSRLNALEDDSNAAHTTAYANDSEDEDFILEEDGSEEDGDNNPNISTGKKRKKKTAATAAGSTGGGGGGGAMRKTRGMIERNQGPKGLKDWIEDAELDRLPPHIPSYLTAVAAPPKTAATRKFCSVCGSTSPYNCLRCGSRYCSLKCYAVHTDTRCLKFMS